MSHSIIVDPHRAVAALVMDDPFFALGPAVAADEPDEARELLETFVEHLDGDPSQMPTIELMNQWQSFLMAFHGLIQVPAELAAERPQEAAGAAAGEQPGGNPGEPAADPTSGGPAPVEGDSVTQPEPAASAGSALPTGEDSQPSPTDPPANTIPCWACEGRKTIEIDGEPFTCGTCGGKGHLPAPAV